MVIEANGKQPGCGPGLGVKPYAGSSPVVHPLFKRSLSTWWLVRLPYKQEDESSILSGSIAD